jgi:hypothetical protein
MTSKWTDLNFKVEPEYHQKFRLMAAIRRQSMKDLLEEMAEPIFKEMARIYPEHFGGNGARRVLGD